MVGRVTRVPLYLIWIHDILARFLNDLTYEVSHVGLAAGEHIVPGPFHCSFEKNVEILMEMFFLLRFIRKIYQQ
jgi:hypothetical protein